MTFFLPSKTPYKYPREISEQGRRANAHLSAAKTSIALSGSPMAILTRETFLELAAISLVEWWLVLPEAG